jgi:hypothetical protein
MHFSHRGRVAAGLLALTLGWLAASAVPASAGQPIGFSAGSSVKHVAHVGSACTGTVDALYVDKNQPIDTLVYTATTDVPSPSATTTNLGRLETRAKDSFSFTFASGTTVQIQVDARVGGVSVLTVVAPLLTCP